jgi:cytochrome P450
LQYAKSLVAGVLKGDKGQSKENPAMPAHSIFHEILNSELPPSEKTDEILFQNATLFLFAGFETTGFTLTLGVASILSDQAMHKRLQDELTSIWPEVGDSTSTPSWTELEKLPFLHACILESLRLSCGVLSRLPRITDHPVVYKDYVIPAGYPISMSQPLIHYNPAIFPEPMTFNPDRWLEGTPEDRKKLERYLVPFSGGSRACIGKHLAMAELHIAFASVIRRFEGMRLVSPKTKDDLMPYHDEFVPSPKMGKQTLWVEVH